AGRAQPRGAVVVRPGRRPDQRPSRRVAPVPRARGERRAQRPGDAGRLELDRAADVGRDDGRVPPVLPGGRPAAQLLPGRGGPRPRPTGPAPDAPARRPLRPGPGLLAPPGPPPPAEPPVPLTPLPSGRPSGGIAGIVGGREAPVRRSRRS